jgi:hypothetical protein
MYDCRLFLKQQELLNNPNVSQVFFLSLSQEFVTSRTTTSQAVVELTRLMETSINKISAIPDVLFFSFFKTWVYFLR